MPKIKLYVKSIEEDGILKQWIENESGEEVDTAPKNCVECREGMFNGHITEDGVTYCSPCFAEKYNDKEREEMYYRGEQFYTEWDESDFDPEIYEVVFAK